MILPYGHASHYLTDYREGRIEMGLGIGCQLDDFLRFKRKQLNIILGHDNVGKSYWFLWYMLALSTHHDLKWCIWMGENPSGKVMRDLIQMYTGKQFMDLTHKEIKRAELKIEYWFKFVDNSALYSPTKILDLFSSSNTDACFIDPFTGLDRGMAHSDNYEFMNNARMFCNQLNQTLYFSTHPNSESGRTTMIYPQDHQWFGHLKPPLKGHIEGGKPFLNRCDDMIIIHRLVKHPDMKHFTMVDVEKVKDYDTGGKQTELNVPLMFQYNYGLGFKIGLDDPIVRKEKPKPEQMTLNGFEQSSFDKPSKYIKPEDTPF